MADQIFPASWKRYLQDAEGRMVRTYDWASRRTSQLAFYTGKG